MKVDTDIILCCYYDQIKQASEKKLITKLFECDAALRQAQVCYGIRCVLCDLLCHC